MADYLQLSDKNWGYLSTPQKKCCLAMKNKQCMAPRGKSIGGSSAINEMMYVRGNREDYNKWVRLGNPGWSYDEVLPYFIKSENSQINGDLSYHGENGLWNVDYAFPSSEIFQNFIQAGEELGVSELDYNGYQQLGISKVQINTKRGQRHSAGTAFLEYSRQRGNLKVVTNALVTKIIIDKKTKTANGVLFIKDDQKFQAYANLEVIISGGSYNSPQLLMLSGIGPKDHLEEVGIDLIADLPVGKNLVEHPLFPGLTFETNFTSEDVDIEEQIQEYLNGLGSLSNPLTINGIGFTYERDNIPLIEFLFVAPIDSSSNSYVDLQIKSNNYNTELMSPYYQQMNPKSIINFYLLLLHQKSKGQVKLKSNNPTDFPDIDLNLFDESEDIDILIEGINYILKLTQTEAFQNINCTLIDDYHICTEHEKYSRHMSHTLFHPCGTTAMGPNSSTSVVNSELQVHGIKKLRVIDAGVIPSTLSGHTNAPTIMIAEKMSDVIKTTYI